MAKIGELNPLQFNKKERARDQQLFSAILDSLIHKNAKPEREANMKSNRLRDNKAAIRRSGLLALAYINRIIHGIENQAGASVVAELIQVRVIHKNPEGMVTFMTKFRELRAKLGSSFHAQCAIEILRARLIG